MERVETVVIGAGQAGVLMSRQLRHHGCEHIVLERVRIALAPNAWDRLNDAMLPNLAFNTHADRRTFDRAGGAS